MKFKQVYVDTPNCILISEVEDPDSPGSGK